MDESSERYNKDTVIGRNAESVFEYLIKSMDGWEIIKYGIENHIDALKNRLKGDYQEVSEKVRHMPDFIILNKSKNKVLLFEVKRTRYIDKNGDKLVFGFQKNLIDKYLKFWGEAKLFIVHQVEPYFYIVDLKDVSPAQKVKSGFYIGQDNAVNNKRPMDGWDFTEIRRSIKEIFPDLKDENITEARKMIIDNYSKKNQSNR